jgi:hypothetical protein
MTRPTTLYRFLDRDGTLLYVGITGVGTVRWFTHSRQKEWWPEVATVDLEHYQDRAEARAAELAAIRTESPRYNLADLVPAGLPRVGGMREYGTGSVYWNQPTKRWVAALPNALGRACKFFRTKEEAEAHLAAALETR